MPKVQTKEPGFDRDIGSMALINNRKDQFELYKQRRENQVHADQEISDLKSEVIELKTMLITLMEKING